MVEAKEITELDNAMSLYIDFSEKVEKETKLDNDLTKARTVGKVENGWIIHERLYGNKDGSDEYTDEHKTWISVDNPIETEDLSASVKSLLEDF